MTIEAMPALRVVMPARPTKLEKRGPGLVQVITASQSIVIPKMINKLDTTNNNLLRFLGVAFFMGIV